MRVAVESPYAGDVAGNVEYARKCLADSIARGESPFASHLIYTQVLDDSDPAQRARGMAIGREWSDCADLFAVYLDRGITEGMWEAIAVAYARGAEVQYRSMRRPGHTLKFVREAEPRSLAELMAAVKRAGWP